MNDTKKETPLPVANSGPRPGDFPLCSIQSRAAARAMMKRKQEEGMRVFIVNGHGAVPDARRQDMIIRINNVPCLNDGCLESDSLSDFSTRQRCDDGTISKASQPSTDAARPEAEGAPPVPQQEQIAAIVAPQQTELESSEEQSSERWAQFVGPRRRPLVRPRPRRYRWPPSAYGL